MITENDKAIFEISIDLARIIWKNDCAAVPELISRVNARSLNDSERNTITDAMSVESATDTQLNGDGDAYAMLVEGLNCLENKPYLLKMRQINVALYRRDYPKLGEIVETTLAAGSIIDPVENDAMYITGLIRACMLLKNYDAMEVIRNRLGD